MGSSDLHAMSQPMVCIADAVDTAIEPGENRRLHQRIKGSELHWLRSARIKYGAEVRVLDISVGGMLLETDNELARDASVVVELSGPTSPILVPSRVLRCRAASVGEILTYLGACAFKRPLTLPELVARTRPQQAPAVVEPALAAAVVAGGWQRVIARYQDGRVMCGYTNDFHPSKTQLHLSANPHQGDSRVVQLSHLKALFFVREFGGNPALREAKDFTDPPQGRRVEVTFHDSEIIVGSTLGYNKDGNGFFVQPADPRSNNLRIFVTTAGMRGMRFL